MTVIATIRSAQPIEYEVVGTITISSRQIRDFPQLDRRLNGRERRETFTCCQLSEVALCCAEVSSES